MKSPITPLVPCDITVERIDTTRTGTPYIVYRTQRGRCCTFISKARFFETLYCLLGVKEQWVGSKISEARALFDIDEFLVRGDEAQAIVSGAELGSFLGRYNRAALEGLQVEPAKNCLLVSAGGKAPHRVSGTDCSCEDFQYRHHACKHRIAAYLHASSLGWGSISTYLRWEADPSLEAMSDEEVLAIASKAKADLGV